MNRKITNPLLIIILISVILRFAASFYFGNQVVDMPGTADQISYHALALRVLNGYGFTFGEIWWPNTQAGAPTAHWSFLYTFFLVIVYALFGPHPLAARLIQALITGILQPYLAYLIGCRLFSKTVGIVAAGLTAIYAYFIYYGASLMTEPFYITLVMGALYLAMLIAAKEAGIEGEKQVRQNFRLPVLLGFTLGGVVLLRQLFLLFIPFLFLWILWAKRKQNVWPTLWGLVVSSVIIIFMILPFTIFNYSRFGRFVFLNTNSGFAFFWANHPIYGTHFLPILPPEMGTYQSLIPKELLSLDEANLDQALLKRGIQFVLDDPSRYILLSISRIPAYFMFWPTTDSGLISNISRVASFGLFLPFMLYGLLLSIFKPKQSILDFLESPLFLLILFIFIYSMIHILSWALIRYRLPVDAILVVFAGLALVDLWQRLANRQRVPVKSPLPFSE